MAAPQLTFEPEAHAYELDGVKVPSVTQVLSFGRDLSRIPRYTGLFGTLVHKACEYDSIGELDESTLVAQEIDGHWCDPWPYLRAWRKYARRRRLHAVELPTWGEVDGLLYAGTIDVVWMRPRFGEPEHEWGFDIDDIKTGKPRPVEHGPQVMAYAHALHQRTGRFVELARAVYLRTDETCKPVDYSENGAAHFETFRRALARYYEETRNG